MDASSHYRRLVQLGREEFLAAAAPAAFIRHKEGLSAAAPSGVMTLTIDDTIEETLPQGRESPLTTFNLEIFPLVKKAGASFPDRITIGRTSNNDVVIADTSVSRFHAYVRRDGAQWVVADAGSKNGSWLAGQPLLARKERPVPSRGDLRFGDVHLTFYLAADLFKALGGV